ncbi:MAG: FAD-binding protein, partial [Acetobacteraceae bacterium]|nr:FAD-binding protein [Acetobacteraceae bacterium]
GGRLHALRSPLEVCRAAPDGAPCRALFRQLKNPYAIGEDPALIQSCGWVDAWTAAPSAYVVAAEAAEQVAAAVDFARTRNLRLVVGGGGHAYLGTSTAPDSLMIWTRAMNRIAIHDGFVPRGCRAEAVPAVSVGAGAIWMDVYRAVTRGPGGTCRAAAASRWGSRGLCGVAVSARTRSGSARRAPLSWRRRWSPRTARSGSSTPAGNRRCSGPSKEVAAAPSG